MQQSVLAYTLAAAAIAIVPGPTVSVIIAQSLKHGARAGLAVVLGTQLGLALWLIVAALGLGATLSMMGSWFYLLKLAGAAYLVWLAINLFRSTGDLAKGEDSAQTGGSLFLQGLVVIASNPKLLVLFGSLIPPALTPGGNVFRETITLGLIFAGIAAVTDCCYALLAGQAGAFLSRKRIRILEIASGCCLVAGAMWMLAAGR